MSMSEPMVSIVVPVYNAQKVLARCLDSLIGQTYAALEIICINDGSKDASLQICKAYAERDSRIRIIDQQNGGVSAARNAGVDASQGEYLMFVDSDDRVSPDIVRKMADAARREGKSLVLCNAIKRDLDDPRDKGIVFDCKNHFKGVSRKDGQIVLTAAQFHRQLCRILYHTSLLEPCWGKLYDAAKWREIGVRFPLDMSLGEDFMANLAYYEACDGAVFLDAAMYHYHVGANEDTLTKRYRPNLFDNQMRQMRRLWDILKRYRAQDGADQEDAAKEETAFYNYCAGHVAVCVNKILDGPAQDADEQKAQKIRAMMDDPLAMAAMRGAAHVSPEVERIRQAFMTKNVNLLLPQMAKEGGGHADPMKEAKNREAVQAIEADVDALSGLADGMMRSAPLRAAELVVLLKHALKGTPGEKKECRRWLLGRRAFIPKFCYVHQLAGVVGKIRRDARDIDALSMDSRELAYWLDVAERCAPLTAAQKAMPKAAYVRQMAQAAKALEDRVRTVMFGSEALPTEEIISGLKRYEYKYARYLAKRATQFALDFSQFAVCEQKGLVSVVLPVCGEGDMEAAVASVLAQTYARFELIIVGAAQQSERFAGRDARIRVMAAEGATRFEALNRGFDAAQGEFLTWIDAGSRMTPDCLEKLAGFLQRRPDLALGYANLREDGEAVRLPEAGMRLNTYAENAVGAAFLYRRAAVQLLGGYDPQLGEVADHDYWMRLNSAFGVGHADVEDALCERRALGETPETAALREKLVLLEDFREDFLIRPMCWVLENPQNESAWDEIIAKAKHIRRTPEAARALSWPRLGSCVVQVTFAGNEATSVPQEKISGDALRVLIRSGAPRAQDAGRFDLLVQLGSAEGAAPEGWIRAENEKAAFDLIQIFCKARWLGRMLAHNRAGEQPETKATIVLCTYKRTDIAKQAIDAMVRQTMDDYEVLVVNNDPASGEMARIVEAARRENPGKAALRYLDCPYPGLSYARNFSLYEARGEIMLYVDDDGIMETDCLERLADAFDAHPDHAVIGGQILLKDPQRFADVILPGYEAMWSERRFEQKAFFTAKNESEFPYGCNYAIRRDALQALGGFRVTYGRMGKDFSGGEEMVLSYLAQRMGGKVGIEPRAVIHHDVEPSRYTLHHVRQTMRSSRLTNRLMKMDMYRSYDILMNEEYMLLGLAKKRLEELAAAGAAQDDLRCQYARFDVEATKEAIEAGNRDVEAMKRMELR